MTSVYSKQGIQREGPEGLKNVHTETYIQMFIIGVCLIWENWEKLKCKSRALGKRNYDTENKVHPGHDMR